MISDKLPRILAVGLLLFTPFAAFGKSELHFAEFVITAKKFQRILWQEFLIEFPNIYAKKTHRIFKTGTVVFFDSEQSPSLLLFANQEMSAQKEGLISRITRLNIRSTSGREFLDIVVTDVGKNLKKTPLEKLLLGKLPLDVEEPGLQEKQVSIAGDKLGQVKFSLLIRSGQAGEVVSIFNLVSQGRNLYRLRDIRQRDSREITWFVHPQSWRDSHTLTARKVKTDWMLFGSETFHVDGRERTPAAFQRRFSSYGIQRLILNYQKQLKSVVQSAGCYPDCEKEKDEGNNG